MKHVSTLLASAATLPRRDELGSYMEDVSRAEARGYFLPDEDERIRAVYTRYLAVRTSLLSILSEMTEGQWTHHKSGDLKQFAVVYAAACLLVRAASYLIDLTEDAPITRKKLDDPEPRFKIESKSFTQIYKSLTSPRRWWAFFDATTFYHKHCEAIVKLDADPAMQPVVDLLKSEEGLVDL